MIASMTAYSQQEASFATAHLICECRAVNHRYLEIQCRLPESMRQFELRFREMLRKRLKRGKIDLSFSLQLISECAGLAVNQAIVDNVLSLCHTLEKSWRGTSQLSMLEVLRWPGAIRQEEIEPQLLQEQASALLDKTISALIDVRLSEGQQLKETMLEKLSALEECLILLAPYQDDIMAQQTEKLQQRLAKQAIDVDQARLEQEIVMWAQKADIAEELDRLNAHVAEVTRLVIADDKEAHGKRLDFLMQELNREANTIAAKAQALVATNCAVDIKVLVEQLREQVQNIE